MRDKHGFKLTIPEAEEKLRDKCESVAKLHYGDILPQSVSERMEIEIEKICDNGFATHYLIAMQLCEASREIGYAVTTRGHIGSSLVAFLCGISELNPLAAHYCCRNCHHFELIENADEWWNPGFQYDSKQCPDCGAIMHGDGIDILSEVGMAISFDREPNVTINVAPKAQPMIIKALKESFGDNRVFRAGVYRELADGSTRKDIHPGGVYILPEEVRIEEISSVRPCTTDELIDICVLEKDYLELQDKLFKYDVLQMEVLGLLYELERSTGRDYHTFKLGEGEILQLFLDDRIREIPILTDEEKSLIRHLRPRSFTEIVKIVGRMKSTWRKKSTVDDAMEGRVRISETVSTRDDIMQFLMYKGMRKGDAYRIMESVRKGRGLDTNTEERMARLDVPPWFIESCRNAQYLYPRAQIASYVMVCWALAGYLRYYPAVFNELNAKYKVKENNDKKRDANTME